MTIKGMTCSGCEEHVKHEVNNLEGISEVNASFEKGNAVIKYNTDKVSEAQIEEAINKTGYTVVKPAKKN
ncbi:MAG TPA: cation transporter [Fulvivirga sp.]|nr:cation transporter [Fulvivirga sp.]